MQATYYLSLARRAPRNILPDPRKQFTINPVQSAKNELGRDRLSRSMVKEHPESRASRSNHPETKDYYWSLATRSLDRASSLSRNSRIVLDGQGELF